MIIRFYKHNNTYGGNEFVDYDTDRGEMVAGNTASTSVPLDHCNISVEVKTYRDLKGVTGALRFNNVIDLGRK